MDHEDNTPTLGKHHLPSTTKAIQAALEKVDDAVTQARIPFNATIKPAEEKVKACQMALTKAKHELKEATAAKDSIQKATKAATKGKHSTLIMSQAAEAATQEFDRAKGAVKAATTNLKTAQSELDTALQPIAVQLELRQAILEVLKAVEDDNLHVNREISECKQAAYDRGYEQGSANRTPSNYGCSHCRDDGDMTR